MHQSIKSSFIAWKSFLTQTYYNLLFLVSWACARIGVHRPSLCLQYLMFSIHSFCHRISAIGIIVAYALTANPLDSSLASQMQGRQPARKSSFYAVIDYMRHRVNFSQLKIGSEDCLERTMLAAQRPCPVLKRFSSTHYLRSSSWPGGQTDGTATREWFTTSVAEHSAHQAIDLS